MTQTTPEFICPLDCGIEFEHTHPNGDIKNVLETKSEPAREKWEERLKEQIELSVNSWISFGPKNSEVIDDVPALKEHLRNILIPLIKSELFAARETYFVSSAVHASLDSVEIQVMVLNAVQQERQRICDKLRGMEFNEAEQNGWDEAMEYAIKVITELEEITPETIPNGSYLQTAADTIKELGLVREEMWPTPRQQERQRIIEDLKGMRKKLSYSYDAQDGMSDDEVLGFNQAIDQAIKAVEEL